MASDNNWEELLGSKNWEGLLNPLDDSLRDFILRCGDLAVAANDAFNDDPNHPFAGSSKYGPKDLLKSVNLHEKYTVNDELLRASSTPVPLPSDPSVGADTVGPRGLKPNFIIWSKNPTFIGYVAVSSGLNTTGHREIVVAWRGTRTAYEWFNNVYNSTSLEPVPLGTEQKLGDPEVNAAWKKIYMNHISSRTEGPRGKLMEIFNVLLKNYEREKLSIIFVGHSLGGALAILSAFDVVENYQIGKLPVCAMVFGCPKIGNKAFFDRIKEKHPKLKILSVKNKGDPVPTLPRLKLYVDNTAHAVLQVDFNKSPYLRRLDSRNPIQFPQQHDLESLLHTVAGWNGEDQEFKGKKELELKRKLSLVNKNYDMLVPEEANLSPVKRSLATANKYYDMLVPEEAKFVPVKWFQQENKGMVMDKDGNWFLQKHA